MKAPEEQYFFCRMAHNQFGWQGPHEGRRGVGFAKDYIDREGYGQEDWNFAGDVWEDGKCHLSVRGFPTKKTPTTGNFTVVLYEYVNKAVSVVGLARKSNWARSKMPKNIRNRRVQEVMSLAETGDLGPNLSGMSKQQVQRHLVDESELYCIAVNPADIERFEVAINLPPSIFKPKNYAYRKYTLTQSEFASIETYLKDEFGKISHGEDASSEEGRLLEAKHKYRERDSSLVRKAKQRYIEQHGRLSCEACLFEPFAHFAEKSFQNKLIEAHHDIWLASDEHIGETKIEDLKMLCPNCHRAIHLLKPKKTVAEFIEYLAERRRD